MSDRLNKIETILKDKLNPSSLEVIDDSHLHIGHAGAEGGAGHYTIRIASQCFKDKSRIQSHKLIYEALADMLPNEIHALRIKILT